MNRLVTRIHVIVIAILLAGAVAAEAQQHGTAFPQNQLRVRLGLFEPAGDSDGWDNLFEGFTATPSDLQDVSWGTDFLWMTNRTTGILIGASGVRGTTTSAYRDWQSFDGRDIRHATRLEISDLTASVVIRLADGRVRPYLGAGGGILWYVLTDEGEFIDFDAPDQPVFWGWYEARGTTFEALGFAGVDASLTHSISVFFEGRYRWAEDTLGDDFSGFGDLSLAGWDIGGGIAFRF